MDNDLTGVILERQFRHLPEWPTICSVPSLNAMPFDRHRGGGHPPTPATPPCVRVRTRRFESVTLTLLEQ
jgi:hypothetical protein